jgi:hypothetical protein
LTKENINNVKNLIDRSLHFLSSKLDKFSNRLIVESVPVPMVKLAREKTFRPFRKSFLTAPTKGYSA